MRLFRIKACAAGFVLLSLLITAACGSSVAKPPASTGTSIATSSPTVYPPGPIACPSTVTNALVTPLLDLSNGGAISAISCGNLENTGRLQALVTVVRDQPVKALDLYILALPPDPLAVLFTLKGETATNPPFSGNAYGEAKISRVSSIMVHSVDLSGCKNSGEGVAKTAWDQEFAWNGSAFMPVVFPGIVPYMSRFSAEAAQDAVDAGKAQPIDPVALVNKVYGAYPFPYSPGPDPAAKIINQDATSSVVQEYSDFYILKRLIGTGNSGIWDITGMQPQDALTITQPVALTTVASPVAIQGTGYTFEGQWSSGVLGADKPITTNTTDNTYALTCSIGSDSVHGTGAPPAASLSGTVNYQTDVGKKVQNGQGTLAGTAYQEGVVMVYDLGGKGSLTIIQMIKVLLK